LTLTSFVACYYISGIVVLCLILKTAFLVIFIRLEKHINDSVSIDVVICCR